MKDPVKSVVNLLKKFIETRDRYKAMVSSMPGSKPDSTVAQQATYRETRQRCIEILDKMKGNPTNIRALIRSLQKLLKDNDL